MKNTVFLYVYANLNLGDDLFIKIIGERYSNTKFILKANKKTYSRAQLPKNVYIINTNNYIYRIIGKFSGLFHKKNMIDDLCGYFCNMTIYIGGSLFIQRDSDDFRAIEKAQNQMLLNKPNAIIGMNFGPYYDDKFLERAKLLFTKLSYICVRDLSTYNLLQDIECVNYAPDIVFALKKKMNFEKVNKQKKICISVVGSNSNANKDSVNQYIKNMIPIIDEFIKKGYVISILGFCEFEGDGDTIDELVSLSKYPEQIKSFKYDGNMDIILEEIATSLIVIGSRFHSLIISMCFNIPIYPIIYSNKSKALLDDLSFTGNYVDISKSEKITINDIEENMHNKRLYLLPLEIEHDAEKHFSYIDRYLLEKNGH